MERRPGARTGQPLRQLLRHRLGSSTAGRAARQGAAARPRRAVRRRAGEGRPEAGPSTTASCSSPITTAASRSAPRRPRPVDRPRRVRRHARRRQELGQTRRPAQRPALPPELLAGGQRRDRLPPVLRRQHAGRAGHGRPGRVRHRPPVHVRAAQAGGVDGLRIDHPDGLYDPKQYFDRLQAEVPRPRWATASCTWRSRRSSRATRSCPADWQVNGTSGYDALIAINDLYVDGRTADRFQRIYADFRRRQHAVRRVDLPQEVARARHVAQLRAEHARPPAGPDRPVEPAQPRLHPQGAARGAAGGDRLLQRLPHLRLGRGRPPHGRGDGRAGHQGRHRPQSRQERGRVPVHRDTVLQRYPVPEADEPPAAAVRRQVPTGDQPGHGQGDRGHGVLHLQPPDEPERGRRRPRPVRPPRRRHPRLLRRSAGQLAAGPEPAQHARHQAERGRAGPHQRPVGVARRVGRGVGPMVEPERPEGPDPQRPST